MIITAENFEQCRAAYGDEYLVLHGVARLVPCERCGGLGEYDTPHPSWGSRTCPEAYVSVICPECEGDGKVCVMVEPVTMEDLETEAGDLPDFVRATDA